MSFLQIKHANTQLLQFSFEKQLKMDIVLLC